MKRWGMVGTMLLLVTACVAWPWGTAADVGPKPTLTIRLKIEGQPLTDNDVQIELLTCAEGGARGGEYTLPGLDKLDLQDPSGCTWRVAGPGVYGGNCEKGKCEFSGFLPSRFRVAVYWPARDKLYVTDATDMAGMHTQVLAELKEDGTGHLQSDALPLIGRAWSLPGVLVALPLTLAIEIAILWGYARWKAQPLKRLLLVGIIANAITLPAVWFLAGMGYVLGGLGLALAALALAEVVAWLLEGVAYLALAKLPVGAAFLLSLAANLASFLIGLVFH